MECENWMSHDDDDDASKAIPLYFLEDEQEEENKNVEIVNNWKSSACMWKVEKECVRKQWKRERWR